MLLTCDVNAGFTLASATEVVGLTDEKVCLVQAPMKEKNVVYELIELHIRKMTSVRTNT